MAASHVVVTFGELGHAVTLSPERFRASPPGAKGTPLADLVILRRERVRAEEIVRAIVLDTTHAKDGLLDIATARRASSPAASAKHRVRPGDLIVSRLRPYLRQIALAHPAALASRKSALLACSTEFYVLAPRSESEDVAYLLPFLLSPATQALLAAGQEGGHHPRVPRETLLGLRVPVTAVRMRARTSARIRRALAATYEARARYERLLE